MHPTQNVQVLPLGIHDTFHDAADDIPAGVHGGQANKSTARFGVEQRRTLSHQVGQEDKPVRSDWAVISFLVHQYVGIRAHGLRCLDLGLEEIVAGPLQAQSGGQ